MDISEKQAVWREQKPLFEAEFIHSHLLPFFNFNENTGDYEIKSECVNNTDDEDRKVAYEALNTGWVMWLRAKRDAKAQAVPEGFVLVEKAKLMQIIGSVSMIEPITRGNPYMDSVKRELTAITDVVKTVIKAQEPAK